jgi:hypothetical protein
VFCARVIVQGDSGATMAGMPFAVCTGVIQGARGATTAGRPFSLCTGVIQGAIGGAILVGTSSAVCAGVIREAAMCGYGIESRTMSRMGNCAAFGPSKTSALQK